MPALQIINESYPTTDDLQRLIYYVARNGHLYGLAINPQDAFRQMCHIKQIWHQTEGRQCRHFILSFGSHEPLTYQEVVNVGYQVASYYASRYQIVFAVHLDTGHVHLHFVCNSVSFVDGRKYSGGIEDYVALKNCALAAMPAWAR